MGVCSVGHEHGHGESFLPQVFVGGQRKPRTVNSAEGGRGEGGGGEREGQRYGQCDGHQGG